MRKLIGFSVFSYFFLNQLGWALAEDINGFQSAIQQQISAEEVATKFNRINQARKPRIRRLRFDGSDVAFDELDASPIASSVDSTISGGLNNEWNYVTATSQAFRLGGKVTGRGLRSIAFQVKTEDGEYVTYLSYRKGDRGHSNKFFLDLYNLSAGTYTWRVRAAFGDGTTFRYSPNQILDVEIDETESPVDDAESPVRNMRRYRRTRSPTERPSDSPTISPNVDPTHVPTPKPTDERIDLRSESPTSKPSELPTLPPSLTPSVLSTEASGATSDSNGSNTSTESASPSGIESKSPTSSPTRDPSGANTRKPSSEPTTAPPESATDKTSDFPTLSPSSVPSGSPTEASGNGYGPTDNDGNSSTAEPASSPAGGSRSPTVSPTEAPSNAPSEVPTMQSASDLSMSPLVEPSTSAPTLSPSLKPSGSPTEASSVGSGRIDRNGNNPTTEPSSTAGTDESGSPTKLPTRKPSTEPTTGPTKAPTKELTEQPTEPQSQVPSSSPTEDISTAPSSSPAEDISTAPSSSPTEDISTAPSSEPTVDISTVPSSEPTEDISTAPSSGPIIPTEVISTAPSSGPTIEPTNKPTASPTKSPTKPPTARRVGSIKYGLQDDCTSIDSSKFNICLDLKSESGGYESWMDAFANARDRWESIITDDGDPPMDIRPYFSRDDIATKLPNEVDDLYISAVVTSIDGRGRILGMAGPTVVKESGGKIRPLGGVMRFDKDDIDFMGIDEWRAVIIHEMGHVLGIGTLFSHNGLHSGRSNSDYYSGSRAQDEWEVFCPGGRLPIETDGGQGTAGGHWDEKCLRGEMMTGFLSPGAMQLSRLTIASLADMGYGVSMVGADPYTRDNLGNCGNYCPKSRRLGRGNPLFDEKDERVSAEGHREVLQAAAKELQRQRLNAPSELPLGMTYLAAESLGFIIRDFDGMIKEETVTYDEVRDYIGKTNIFDHGEGTKGFS